MFLLSQFQILLSSMFMYYMSMQALIKDYGHKRLLELGEHKRKRLAAAAALTADDKTPTSTVLQMVSSSTGLLQGVVTMGLLTMRPQTLAKTSTVSSPPSTALSSPTDKPCSTANIPNSTDLSMS